MRTLLAKADLFLRSVFVRAPLALALFLVLQQIERDIPRGILREEREGLMVLALWDTGEHTRARLLAQHFLASYPSSALRERVRALIDAATQEAP